MARNHAADVLEHMTELSLEGTQAATEHVRKAVAALEKANALLAAAELEALERGSDPDDAED